jgi:hypothetical protein
LITKENDNRKEGKVKESGTLIEKRENMGLGRKSMDEK